MVKDLLQGNGRLMERVTSIVPVNSTDEELNPFVRYWFEGIDNTPEKSGRGHDSLLLRTVCYADTPDEATEIAELVRESIDKASAVWVDDDEPHDTLRLITAQIAHVAQFLDAESYAFEVRYLLKLTNDNR